MSSKKLFRKWACLRWALVNVVPMTAAWEWSPVCCVYLATTVSALAAFHQPVVCHSPVAGTYHFCSAPIAEAAQAR